MTKYDALNVALDALYYEMESIENDADLTETYAEKREACGVLKEMLGQLNREKQRKEERKQVRNGWVAEIKPFVREVLSHTQLGMTAKDIFSDFTTLTKCSYSISLPKLQYILLHDMEDEVEAIDNGRNAKTYRLKTA